MILHHLSLNKIVSGFFLFIILFSGCDDPEIRTQIQITDSEPPNILWISAEDLGPRLGCYGDTLAETPHIDQLAAEGLRYTNVFTTAPVCAANRSAMITGMYQTSIGTQHMRTTQSGEGLPGPYAAVPPHYVRAFTEYLRANGYYCTNNAKTDYQMVASGQPWKAFPFTMWDESSNQAHYKNRPDKDQPFFAVFNIEDTHESRNWKKPRKTNPQHVPIPPYYPDIPEVRSNIARLYDNIAIMDSLVGAMLAELEEQGEADNTVVFFWTDHGDGLPRAKRWLYDSGTQIPLVIRWPDKLAAGTVNDDLISSIDFGPTVLSLAQVPIPLHMQGRAFMGSQKKKARKFVYGARDRYDQSYDMVRSVRDKNFLYIQNFYPQLPYVLWVPYRNEMSMMQALLRLSAEDKLQGVQKLWFADQRPPEELYDVNRDPHQINNLAADAKYQKVLSAMRENLNNWRSETGDMGDITESEMVRRMWPGGIQPQTAAPRFLVNGGDKRNLTLNEEGGTFKGPAQVTIYCPSQGASIGYRINDDEHWQLYTGPIRLASGSTTLHVKAIRYGYKESEVTSALFNILAN